MSTPDHPDVTDDDQRHPVQAQDVLDLPDENIEAPSGPSDQPSLPDFNS